MGILEGIGAGVLGVLIGFALILARREDIAAYRPGERGRSR